MPVPMLDSQTKKALKSPLLWMGVVAAALYCSWPLGFVLNPTVAHSALASEFESTGQPYNWLFISLDVLSGAAILAGGTWQWLKSSSRLIRLSILGYMLFAVTVIVAALVPFDCNTILDKCSKLASPFFVIHGIASIVSILFLLLSLVLVFKFLLAGGAAYAKLRMIFVSVFAAWGVMGLGALLIERYYRTYENIIQDVFISVCSLSLILAIYVIEHGAGRKDLPAPIPLPKTDR